MQGSGEPVSDRDENAGAVERRSWLEERVYGGAGATAAEVAELRRLVTAGEPAGTESASWSGAGPESESGFSPHEAEAGDDPPGPRRRRGGRMAAGVALLLVAGLAGAGVEGLIGREGSGHPAAVTAPSMSIGSHPSFAPIFTDPSANDGSPANLEAATAALFSAPQSAADKLPAVFPGVVASSSRQVASVSTSMTATVPFWVARGEDQSFCLVVAVSRTVGGSSCTPRQQAADADVTVTVLLPGGGSDRVDWEVTTGTISTETTPTSP